MSVDDEQSELGIDEERLGDGTCLLKLSGELDLGTVPELRERLEGLGAERIRLDLSKLDFMDSTGVSLLIGATQEAKNGGPAFELVRPQGEAWRVIELTGIEDVLPFVDEQ